MRMRRCSLNTARAYKGGAQCNREEGRVLGNTMAQPVQGKVKRTHIHYYLSNLLIHISSVLEHPARQESVRSQQRSLIAMEETMREKIRELQEQRAAAMMTEIVELQKERDLALGKVKRLENKVKGDLYRRFAPTPI